jgi:ferredoxin-NADP reductase
LTTSFQPAIEVRLVAVRYAAEGTNFFEFEALDGGVLPPATPGAHIGLMLPNGVERQYSLVHAGSALRSYVVGVKREASGRGGSRYMHDHLRVGTVLTIAKPRNNFPLDESAASSVLFAGGIGITPIYCMVSRLLELGRPWRLFYACRTRKEAAFLRELTDLPEVVLHFDDEKGGVLSIADALRGVPATAHLYCCGPKPMLAAFEAATAGRPAGGVHLEYFTAKEEAALEGGFIVELAKSGREYFVPAGRSILGVLIEAGIQVMHSCAQGVCGACETRVLSGEPDHRDAILSDAERKAGKTMMICCSGSRGSRLVLDL